MKTISFDQSWEEKIYSRHAQINRYPYGELVPTLFHSLKLLQTGAPTRDKTKILEIGCGAGNNLWFFCREGFDVFGVDGSESACKIARDQMAGHDFEPAIHHAEFANLPFEDHSMDIIVDREATYCGTLEDIKATWKEARRVLKKGGLVISFFFSDDHPDCVEANRNPAFASRIEENTFTGFQGGTFKDTGITHFATRKELDIIFDFLDIKFINKHSTATVYESCGHQYHYSEWIVVGVNQ